MEGVCRWDIDVDTDFVREVLTVPEAALLFDCVVINDGDIVKVTN